MGLTRREFIATTLAGVAGLALLAPSEAAADRAGECHTSEDLIFSLEVGDQVWLTFPGEAEGEPYRVVRVAHHQLDPQRQECRIGFAAVLPTGRRWSQRTVEGTFIREWRG